MINPHKEKYHKLYWEMVESCAAQSVCERHQVGAIVVTATGLIAPGWNGMPSGFPEACERMIDTDSSGLFERPKTKPEVIHAERNALDKMTRHGVSAEGAIIFISRSPCIECAKSLVGVGIKKIYYDVTHDDISGIQFLDAACVAYEKRNK